MRGIDVGVVGEHAGGCVRAGGAVFGTDIGAVIDRDRRVVGAVDGDGDTAVEVAPAVSCMV